VSQTRGAATTLIACSCNLEDFRSVDTPDRSLRFDMRVSTHYFHARMFVVAGICGSGRCGSVEHNVEEGMAIGHALTYCSVLGAGAHRPITFWPAISMPHERALRGQLLDHTESSPPDPSWAPAGREWR